MVFANKISFTPKVKNLESAQTLEQQTQTFENILVACIQLEEKDVQNPKETETKLVKNVKWAARKNNTKKILLHSFAHLSESKAPADFTKQILDKAQQRLNNSQYQTFQSPFGYFLDISIDCPGYSQARIFKSL